MYRSKTNYTEEAFLLSTFSEFVKCWKSSKKSRLFIETVNGMAFMNFSVFLGNPSEAHSPRPSSQRPYPSSEERKDRKKKSAKKIQRDNERAAKFQAKKRKEQAAASAVSGDSPPATSSKVTENTRAAASAASGNPPQTSSPAESSAGAASVNFSFASPVAEDRTDDAMEGISDPQLSPEDLRQQPEDPPSLILPREEVRENPTEPPSENITITEEGLQENEDTASKETESPGLDFEFVNDVEAVRKKFRDLPGICTIAFSRDKFSWVKESKWFQMNKEHSRMSPEGYDPVYPGHTDIGVFSRRILRCKKPKLFLGSTNEEPCNSPAYDCCGCSPRTPRTPKMPPKGRALQK